MAEKGASARPMQHSESSRLAQWASDGTLVGVYLIKGIQLRGHVLGFDGHAILFKPSSTHAGGLQLVYKHTISTIAPVP